MTAEDFALKTRIAALEKGGAKLKAKNERLEAENEDIRTENENFDTENKMCEAENDKLKEENRVLKALNDTLIEMGTKLEKLSDSFHRELIRYSDLVREKEHNLLACLSLAHEVLAGCFASGYLIPGSLPSYLVPSYNKAMELSKSIPTLLGSTKSDARPADSPTDMTDSDASSDSDYSYRSQSDVHVDNERDNDSDTEGDDDSDGESDSGNDGVEETPDEVVADLLARGHD